MASSAWECRHVEDADGLVAAVVAQFVGSACRRRAGLVVDTGNHTYLVSHNTVTEYSKRKAGMPEERKGQSAGMAYATKAAAEGVGSFCHQFRTEIRHFAALDIAPDTFGRIEVGRIAGEP